MGMIEHEEINFKQLIQEQQWQMLKEKLKDVPIPDIADLLMELSKSERVMLFRVLPRTISSEVFSYMIPELRNALLKELTDEETRNLLSNLRPDDRTTLFEELPGQVTQKLLNLLSPQDIKETRFLLGYPEESVGRLMTPDYVAVRPEWTVEQSLQHFRLKGKDSETLNVIYVTDDKWKLLDSLDLHRFILSQPDARVSDLMDHTFVSIAAFEDREEAVHVLQHYDLFVLPVVDSEGVLLGIVTADDIMDVAEEEATEDFHKTAAVTPLKNTYREASLWELFNKRIAWLIILVLVSLLSASIIGYFESALQTVIILSVFIPMLIGSGGNAGAQSATMIVRALATGDVEVNEWFKTFGKEMLVGLTLGVTMGITGFIIGYMKGGLDIAIIIGFTMLAIILVANLIGVALPFILTRMGLDPAVASSPLIASIVDATGLFIYFVVAVSVLQL